MSRFYNYPEAESLQSDDVFLIDGETDGTRKIPADKMADFFGEQVPTDKTLAVSNMAADAKVVGDEIGELKSALDVDENRILSIANLDYSFIDLSEGTFGKSYNGNIGSAWSVSNSNYRCSIIPPIKLPNGKIKIVLSDGYRFSYRTIDKTTGLITADSGWITTTNIYSISGDYLYALMFGKASDALTTKEELLQNVSVMFYPTIVDTLDDVTNTLKVLSGLGSSQLDLSNGEMGYAYSGSPGNNYSRVTHNNRCVLYPPISVDCDYEIEVLLNEGYRFSFRTINKNNDVVVADSGWITQSGSKYRWSKNYRYAIVFSRTNDGSTTLADLTNNISVKMTSQLVDTVNRIDKQLKSSAANFDMSTGYTWYYNDGQIYKSATEINAYSTDYIVWLPTGSLIEINDGYRFKWYETNLGGNTLLGGGNTWRQGPYNVKFDHDVYLKLTFAGVENESFANIAANCAITVGNLQKYIDNQDDRIKSNVTENPNIKSVNHRGYNTVAPENTLPAFQLSRQKGFRYVETDVRFTSDDVPILLHDATINRTARNADGTELSDTVYIADITYDDALDYDFGIWKGESYAGTKIPTLAEFMGLCRNIGLTPRVELNVLTVSNAVAMFDVINAYGMARQCEYNCNNLDVAAKFLELEPSATIVYGMSTYDSTTVDSIVGLKTINNRIIINMAFTAVTNELINKCKSGKVELEVWTVNSQSVIEGLDPYISGVTSDSLDAGKIMYNFSIA